MRGGALELPPGFSPSVFCEGYGLLHPGDPFAEPREGSWRIASHGLFQGGGKAFGCRLEVVKQVGPCPQARQPPSQLTRCPQRGIEQEPGPHLDEGKIHRAGRGQVRCGGDQLFELLAAELCKLPGVEDIERLGDLLYSGGCLEDGCRGGGEQELAVIPV